MSDNTHDRKRVTFASGTVFTPAFGSAGRGLKSFSHIKRHVLDLLISDKFDEAERYLTLNLGGREKEFFSNEEGEIVFRQALNSMGNYRALACVKVCS